jgi:hypothetical protein
MIVAENRTAIPLTDSVKQAIHELHNCLQEITMEVHPAERGHTGKTINSPDLISAVDLMNDSLEELKASLTILGKRSHSSQNPSTTVKLPVRVGEHARWQRLLRNLKVRG